MDVEEPPTPGDPPGLTIGETHDETGAYILTLAGEIDLSTLDVLRESVGRVVNAGPTSIAFAVHDVEFIDSSGLAVFIEASRAAPVRLVDPSYPVRRVVELSGLGTVLQVTSG